MTVCNLLSSVFKGLSATVMLVYDLILRVQTISEKIFVDLKSHKECVTANLNGVLAFFSMLSSNKPT